MAVDWDSLRVWNGSKSAGFEELCCQLAAGESMPSGSRFLRKGAPDAGVECFWRLPGGDEWGWQAKYFRSALTSTQWREIDNSVRTAIAKHPRLTKYTICTPMNRSDAKLRGQKSFMQKWEEHVRKWRRIAAARHMNVEFEYWGEHEIGLRLSPPPNRSAFTADTLLNFCSYGTTQLNSGPAGAVSEL